MFGDRNDSNRLALHLMCRGESKARGILGSSTLVVASIVGNKMSVGNIGDSGPSFPSLTNALIMKHID